LERVLRFTGKFSVKMLEASADGLIRGALKCVGPKGLDIMIEHDWYIIESLFYAMRYKPSYPDGLSEEQIAQLESSRAGITKIVLPALGMAKMVANKLPPSLIENSLDGGWLMRRAKERYPVLAERVEAHGERGRRWIEKQAKELRDFLLGRLRWDDKKRRMVRVRLAKKA